VSATRLFGPRPAVHRGLLGLIVGLSLIGLAAALVSQHHFDMQPCAWCALQRLLLALAGLSAAAGLVKAPVAAGAFSALSALWSIAGLVAALWQHFVAAQTVSCNLSLADRVLAWTQLDALLPEVFQPRASCADAKVDLLGVPYELWSAALFALLTVLALAALRPAWHRRGR
jgi:protein dithiol:quinone oxidoreductase